jgi:hypothetical protein
MLIYYILSDYEAGALHGKVFTTKELCMKYANEIGLTEGRLGKLSASKGQKYMYDGDKPVAVIRVANLCVN